MSVEGVAALFREGVEAHVAGDLSVAREKYRQVLAMDPQHAGSLANLGRIARTRKDNRSAVRFYEQAAKTPNAPPEVFFNLGNVLFDLGEFQKARDAFARSADAAPTFAKALDKLAACLEILGDLAGATKVACAAVESCGDDFQIILRAARICEKAGAVDKAVVFYRKTLKLAPELDEAATRLSQLLFRRGEGDEAVAILRALNSRWPDDPTTLQNLGFIYRATGHYRKALRIFEQASDCAPERDILKVETANCLINLGRASEGQQLLNRLVATPQGRRVGGSSYLMATLYDPGLTPSEIRDGHKRLTADWRCEKRIPVNRRSASSRPLRVGYLTSDFYGEHPVAQFIAPVLRAHAKPGADIVSIAYDFNPRHDATARSMSAICEVRDLASLADEEAAARIAADNLDILVDLSGHTSGRRLPILGLRPAPVQACFIGYPSTTGFEAVDWLVADATLIPQEHEHLYTENIARLPDSFLCFSPPREMPSPAKKQRREIVFGSLNHLPKINAEVIRLWSQILQRVPGSRLLLQCAAFAEIETAKSVRECFVSNDVESNRIVFHGPQPFAEAMKRYDEIDIALDPFPYNGGTTTCHALWMGTPVISLEGGFFCGRMGASILRAANRSRWLARTPAEYVEKAVALASDQPALRREQEALSVDIRRSALCEIDRYAGALADLYKKLFNGTP
ncbi:MAG: tetratricopeptide repeat protein [Parvularculaceae bacterium]